MNHKFSLIKYQMKPYLHEYICVYCQNLSRRSLSLLFMRPVKHSSHSSLHHSPIKKEAPKKQTI